MRTVITHAVRNFFWCTTKRTHATYVDDKPYGMLFCHRIDPTIYELISLSSSCIDRYIHTTSSLFGFVTFFHNNNKKNQYPRIAHKTQTYIIHNTNYYKNNSSPQIHNNRSHIHSQYYKTTTQHHGLITIIHNEYTQCH